MRALRLPALAGPIFGVLAALAMAPAMAQTPYPDLTIQDVDWTSGTHHYAVTQRILSPSTPDLPVVISESADAEFVSGTQVRLKPGFHAGGFNSSTSGRFRARIDDSLGEPGDVVIISPAPDGSSPYGSIVDNVIHVHKWEKVEVGMQLPQDYRDAIDDFFQFYYPYASAPNVSDPSNTDPIHHLNPYADDSLQLVLTLTHPTGSQRLKWGFFMREAMWTNNSPNAQLTANAASPLHPYDIRFRFAPDAEGPWQFSVSVKAPYTTTAAGAQLPELLYSGYALVCDPPLPDNKGPLSVNEANGRVLKFENDEPFIGLGVNLVPARTGTWWNNPNDYRFLRRDFDRLSEAMPQLHEVGGNFARMMIGDKTFSPEYVNLGVYDRYSAALTCGQTPVILGDGQYQCWAFDRMVDLARTNGIYIQMCVDPFPPIIDYETHTWYHNPYLNSFVKPRNPATGLYDMKRFFYPGGDSTNTTDGVFYYWKRKYKYMMSRWGYSVNIPIIEPFNEIDQMLTYGHVDLTNANAICPENQLDWLPDPGLPVTIDHWITDITNYVRDPVDPDHPTTSPLGEKDKLFLLSYAGGPGYDAPDAMEYYRPFTNANLDLIDKHLGIITNTSNYDHPDEHLVSCYNTAQGFWDVFPYQNALPADRKPFNHGEFHYSTNMSFGGWNNEIEKIFHNYDVSFHNEIWASAFSGRFAAGSTWKRERVFWWSDALPVPPNDVINQFQFSPSQQFSTDAGDENGLWINGQVKLVRNNRLHHHFRPLAELLNRPSVVELGIFSEQFTPRAFFDSAPVDTNPIECYYLTGGGSTAIGWAHNRNASVAKSFYAKSGQGNENFLGCTAPTSASITLTGFFPLHAHYVTWFPTRIGATDLPPDTEFPNVLMSTVGGDITINLSGYFNGIADNYLDTLHSDYAFVITPQPFFKTLNLPNVAVEPSTAWDYVLYPNPTRNAFSIRFPDDRSKDVAMLDVSGRRVAWYPSVTSALLDIPTDGFAQGAYWVQVMFGGNAYTKKLIIP